MNRTGWFARTLDRAIAALSPTWAQRRATSRRKIKMLAGGYDAASGGRRTSGWRRNRGDANAVTGRTLARLRELSRDLYRNNGWARRAIEVITNNTVGRGISAKAEASAPSIEAEATALFNRWSKSVHCDYDGRFGFGGIQALVMATVALSGSCLVLRDRRTRPSDNLPVPLRVRLLEPDYLDSSRDGTTHNGNPLVGGIEFNAGRRVAYWMFPTHPGSAGMTSVTSVRIPAEDVIHVYKVERPGQVDGVAWLAAAMVTLNDLGDFDDAELLQQKVAACFAAFVTDPDGEAAATLGEENPANQLLEQLGPGMIEYLLPGQEVSFAQPPPVQNSDFNQKHLRKIAAALGIPYTEMTLDFEGYNFSTARMERIASVPNYERWQSHMLIPQLCDGVWRWAMELAAPMNGWTEIPTATWTTPPLRALDPVKASLAFTRDVRSGRLTYQGALREQGVDPDRHMAEQAESNAQLDALGIILDSDPRNTTAAGMFQIEDNANALGDPDDG